MPSLRPVRRVAELGSLGGVGMKRIMVLVLAFALGCAGGSSDLQGWAVDGRPAPDEPWRKRDGPFLAMLFLTDQAEALYNRWNTEPGNFATRNIHAAPPGTKVEAVVVFLGCEPDASGNCNVWGSATVETDDGRVLARDVQVPLWVGRPAVPDPALNISEHGVGLVVEESVSSYRLHMVVSDRTAQREVRLVHELAVSSEQ